LGGLQVCGSFDSLADYSASKAAMNAYSRTLACEESSIACFSVRPGVVDTDMQVQIRTTNLMPPEQRAKFVSLYEDNKLLPAEKPGHVLAALAVNGSRSDPVLPNGKAMGAQGEFASWDDPFLDQYQLAII